MLVARYTQYTIKRNKRTRKKKYCLCQKKENSFIFYQGDLPPYIFYKNSTDQKYFFNKRKTFAFTHRYEKDIGLFLGKF